MSSRHDDQGVLLSASEQFFQVFTRACRVWAIMGGGILCIAMTLTVVSVVGRAIGIGPVDGDFEMMEIATAIAVFAFMPYTQMTRGHVIVDVFTQNLPRPALRFLDVIGTIAMTAVALIWLWRMPLGAYDFFQFGDETTVLRYMRWWSFILILPSVSLFAGACVLSIFRDSRQ